jgi:hypothetical protein
MKKGAKFREMPDCNKAQIYAIFNNIVQDLKLKLAKSAKIKKDILDKWQDVLINLLNSNITKLNDKDMDSNSVLYKVNIKNYINYLHNKFVIVPVDKASNNFAIICKQFYLNVLKSELGIKKDVVLGNDVYEYVHMKNEDLYLYHSNKLKDFNIKLDELNKNIPLLYWTSKQHKNPYKFRFIAGACRCTSKQISIEVSLALKCIKSQFKNYCNVIKKRSGLSCYWSIDNSLEFVDKLSHINHAYSIETFDFSTLYTNLPLQTIYDSLKLLIIKMYSKNNSNIILVNVYKKKSFWCGKSSYSGYIEYTIDKLLNALEFVIFETYIQFGNNIFKQIKGIPMGGNASPLIADLYLSWCEFIYMMDLAKYNYTLAYSLKHTSRYLDDIATVNYRSFLYISKDVYHSSLVLDKNDHDHTWDTFLDLFIRIKNKRFIIGIYHKVDDFNFEVINFPFPDSNIHSSTGYKTFYSQLVRFYRICNNQKDFLTRSTFIYSKLLGRGYLNNNLYKYYKRFTLKFKVGLKFGVSDLQSLWHRIVT